MAGPAPIATGLDAATRRLFEDEKKRLEEAKNKPVMPPAAQAAPTIPLSEQRKGLADTIGKFAREEIAVNPQQLVESGAGMGVSRDQIRSLYQKYRSEFQSNLPEGYTPKTANALGESQLKVKYASQFETQKQPTPAAPASNAGQMASTQNEPLGSAMMGASGVQGAVGGLSRGPSRTGGTPIGRMSSDDRMSQIATNLLRRAYRERQREASVLNAEEDAFNRVYGGGGELKQMPFFQNK